MLAKTYLGNTGGYKEGVKCQFANKGRFFLNVRSITKSGLKSAFADPNHGALFNSSANPCGLHCLTSPEYVHLLCVKEGNSPNFSRDYLRIPKRQYNNAVTLLVRFLDYSNKHNPNADVYLAWIYSRTSVCVPYPPAMASRGINLKNIVFIESSLLSQTLQLVCSDPFFSGIVFDDCATRAALAIAKRWLKPPSQPELFKGEDLSSFSQNKIFIFLD